MVLMDEDSISFLFMKELPRWYERFEVEMSKAVYDMQRN